MKTAFSLLLVLLLLLLLMGCYPEFQTVRLTNVPVKGSGPNSAVDFDFILDDVQSRVRERLPDAYYRGAAFTGKCQDLPELQGQIIVKYMQVKPSFLLGQQILHATAVVTTSQGLMDITFRDVSDPYISTEEKPLATDNQFREITRIAHQHLLETGISDCEIAITQTRDTWNAMCRSPREATADMCNFDIDADSGEITPQK